MIAIGMVLICCFPYTLMFSSDFKAYLMIHFVGKFSETELIPSAELIIGFGAFYAA
jgi:hypothetical protein